jgi:hypothetical protein
VENENQIWHCGQVQCEYSEKVNPHERFRVTVEPINAENCPQGDAPYAQLQAVGISTGDRWIGPCLPWPLTRTALEVFGQTPVQLAGIRNSLLNGMAAELAGIAAPLGVREQELRKAGLKRANTSANLTLSPIFV